MCQNEAGCSLSRSGMLLVPHSLVNFCGLALITFAMIGCGASNPLERQKVSGEVLLGGSPVASGSIRFEPAGDKGTMAGATIQNGQYMIPTQQGLPPGEYIVRISAANTDVPPEEAPGESNKLAVELIPKEFNTDSQQRVTVVTGEKNVFDFSIPQAAGK